MSLVDGILQNIGARLKNVLFYHNELDLFSYESVTWDPYALALGIMGCLFDRIEVVCVKLGWFVFCVLKIIVWIE